MKLYAKIDFDYDGLDTNSIDEIEKGLDAVFESGEESTCTTLTLLSVEKDVGEFTDGYHSFNELYHHRMVLFSVICNQNKDKAWKSKLHDDGTMYDNYFIVGITIDGVGDYTYHYHLDNWNYFEVVELEKAPPYDGHLPSDITRLLALEW